MRYSINTGIYLKFNRVYFNQYGQTWSFSIRDAISMIGQILKGQEYNFDKLGKRVKYTPFGTYAPLDWDESIWSDCLNEIIEANIRRKNILSRGQ